MRIIIRPWHKGQQLNSGYKITAIEKLLIKKEAVI